MERTEDGVLVGGRLGPLRREESYFCILVALQRGRNGWVGHQLCDLLGSCDDARACWRRRPASAKNSIRSLSYPYPDAACICVVMRAFRSLTRLLRWYHHGTADDSLPAGTDAAEQAPRPAPAAPPPPRPPRASVINELLLLLCHRTSTAATTAAVVAPAIDPSSASSSSVGCSSAHQLLQASASIKHWRRIAARSLHRSAAARAKG